MTIFIEGYSLGNKMAIVATSEPVYEELMAHKDNVLRVYDNRILFQPEGISIGIKGVASDRIKLLNDYDIVEISDSGILYRAFANREADTTVFLGAKCNSNCIMCPASDSERKKGFSYSRDILLQYIDYLPNELEYIVMTGGEPTMQTDLFLEALDKVREKYPTTQVLLLTNGRSLSDSWLFSQVNERHPAHFKIAIPLHGASSDLHDMITRASGSFDQTMLGLKRLMNSDIDVEIRIVVTKANCEYLLEIAQLIAQNFPRVYCINFIGLEPRGNCALNFESVYIDHRTSFVKSKAAIQFLISRGYDVGLYNYPLCAVDKDFWPLASKSISGYKNVYHKDCEQCSVQSICGGFFTAAMSIAKPQVFPIIPSGGK